MDVVRVGIDIGSTTIKIAAVDERNRLIFSKYTRHFSDIRKCLKSVIEYALEGLWDIPAAVAVTGSGGLLLARKLGVSFVQEVIAQIKALETYAPDTDVAIELGGEDAKIVYLTGGQEQRMNGTCAGGTGSFIDQMASLLGTDVQGLNDLAAKAETIYPIASRCGVFAKTDIQPLLNEGARKEDIAASVFQSVVVQTISGLACGRPIRGNVAFLGGPLTFLPQLRAQFIKTLELKPEQVIFSQDMHLFVACGAAMLAPADKTSYLSKLAEILDKPDISDEMQINRLRPLFCNEDEYIEFKQRHCKETIPKGNIAAYKGKVYLGIDAGSTTTKAVLIGEDKSILEYWYGSNNADPVRCVVDILTDLYSRIPDGVNIASAGVTGYGEELIKAALRVDTSEIETIAHYRAAREIVPDVDFILDIGGQDMKCLHIRNGAIDTIFLNEACSSGCGSFLETFASQLNIPIEEFANLAVKSKNPVDLGSRCTVFMNSRIKQAQKEGAGVEDISAGLAYSVVKNALYKVIKIRNPSDMGKKIMVQGGTFLNDAVLRAFEIVSGRECIRSDIAGLMGAYGMALIARERCSGQTSSLLSPEEVKNLVIRKKSYRCSGCTNNCSVTVNIFDNRRYITGNRCEKGAGGDIKAKQVPNIYREKYKRLFEHYVPLEPEKAKRGRVGIQRALNMFENYPFWFTFFTELGFRVELSAESNKMIYEKGIESIPSESVCYPAKLSHGHIVDLIEKGVDFIFMPCIEKEKKEDPNSDQCFNCPIVTGYSEVLRNNVEQLRSGGVRLINDFIPYNNREKLIRKLCGIFTEFGISPAEIRRAVYIADEEDKAFKRYIHKMGEDTIKWLYENNKKGIVLAGRPYHIDPEINHGIADMISSFGIAVLTEDSIAHLGSVRRPLRVRDQWMFHTRLYNAADVVAKEPCLQMVQLNSFGCGIDAVTIEQVQEILETAGKIHTVIKIDEVSNLGAAKIRIRSLLAAMNEREGNLQQNTAAYTPKIAVFTRKDRVTHTILAPQMSPIHFDILEQAFNSEGYNLEVLPEVKYSTIEEGLKHVNNDACYPSIIVVGQLLQALKSGRYDLDRTSVIMFQTGGGCRASNYIAFIRKALKDAGMEHIPVISLNTMRLEKQQGFRLTARLLHKALQAIVYGDLFMRVLYATRPYEAVEGSAERLYGKWANKCKTAVSDGKWSDFVRNIENIVREFDNIPLLKVKKPKVGIVGEILVKYHPEANNNLVRFIESEGCEAVVPDLAGFLLYCLYNGIARFKYGAENLAVCLIRKAAISILELYRRHLVKCLQNSVRFSSPADIYSLAGYAEEIISTGICMGEGWLLTAEMLELIKEGVDNIVCVQPFACLPNHVAGKGMIKEIRRRYPGSNIVAVDYDPGASEVNQLNRIKLMLSVAFKKLKDEASGTVVDTVSV